MKNIHVLPTDKPSRLWKNNLLQGKLELSEELLPYNTSQNIYITSDEKIKEGDWVIKISSLYKGGGNIQKYSFVDVQFEDITFKKIILTTDQDLIKDGVQKIDDEFLEWFVKNPSCEWVEVDLVSVNEFGSEITVNGYGFDKFIYKIIIPKEEPIEKSRKVCKCKRAYENPLSEICSLCWNELYPNEKDEIKDEDLLEPKQETLEEAAEIFVNNRFTKQICGDEFYPDIHASKEAIVESHVLFTKWQQEQDKNKYSEEEVLDVLRNFYRTFDAMKNPPETSTIPLWFEQFKKK
jgi:hypothetical protein